MSIEELYHQPVDQLPITNQPVGLSRNRVCKNFISVNRGDRCAEISCQDTSNQRIKYPRAIHHTPTVVVGALILYPPLR